MDLQGFNFENSSAGVDFKYTKNSNREFHSLLLNMEVPVSLLFQCRKKMQSVVAVWIPKFFVFKLHSLYATGFVM